MCLSFSRAKITNTIIGLFVGSSNPAMHCMVYQAMIEPENPGEWSGFFGALPKKPGSSVSAIDGGKAPSFLKDLADKALGSDYLITESRTLSAKSLSVQVIETENFMFFVAENAKQIPIALNDFFNIQNVPNNERVALSDQAMDKVQKIHHEKMAFFIALRKPNKAKRSYASWKPVPFGICYEALDPTKAFIPGEDDHTGNGPEAKSVRVAHKIVLVTSQPIGQENDLWVETDHEDRVKVVAAIPALEDYYHKNIKGWKRSGSEPNGDWVIDLKTGKLSRVPLNQLKGLYTSA